MNERQRRFAEYYAADPNATAAAIAAGYSRRTAHSQGQRLLKNVEVQNFVQQLQDQQHTAQIMTISEVRSFWSQIAQDENEKTANRLRASELLAKSYGLFFHDGDRVDGSGGDDVVIYLPELDGEG